MTVPSLITDLSTTAASNSPAGSEPIGTNLDDYLRAAFSFIKQLFDTADIWAGTAGGTKNALTLTPVPAITAYKVGQALRFKAGATANDAATTVNISGIGAIDIQNAGAALIGGEIQANQHYRITLDTTSTAQLEAINLYAPPFTDSTALIKGSVDDTKQLRLEVDGLTTGTTRVWTAPDKDGTVAMTSDVQDSVNALLGSPAFTGTPTAPTAGTNTSTTQLATCAFVNPANALSTNGYQKLSSGLIIQWGFRGAATSTSNDIISFPIPFPNALYSVNLTNFVSAGLGGGDAGYSNLVSSSLSSFTTQYTCNRYWWAVGK